MAEPEDLTLVETTERLASLLMHCPGLEHNHALILTIVGLSGDVIESATAVMRSVCSKDCGPSAIDIVTEMRAAARRFASERVES